MIASWWASLSLIMKILWGVTLAASLVFIIQSVLTFIGADMGGDFDTDFDTGADFSADGDSGMNLYSFRNFVNFLLGFGWSAILLQDKISSTGLLLTFSFVIGIGLVGSLITVRRHLDV